MTGVEIQVSDRVRAVFRARRGALWLPARAHEGHEGDGEVAGDRISGDPGTGGIQPVKVTGETIMAVNQKVRVGEGMDITMRNAFMPPEDATALTDAELALIEQFIGAK